LNVFLSASSIVLGSPQWSGLAGALCVPLLLLVLWGTWRAPLPANWKWSLCCLKSLAIVLLAVCLLDPRFTRHRARPGENIVLLLVDQSASMQMRRSSTSSETRGDWARRMLDPNQEWHTELARNFKVRKFLFGDGLHRVESLQSLEFQAPASRLGNALSGIQSRFRGQPLAAILLVSDGNSTDGAPAHLEQLGIPVFPIVEEHSSGIRDIGIRQISVSQTNFEDAPVTVQAHLGFAGERPRQVVVELEAQAGQDSNPPQIQTLAVPPENDLTVRFQLHPQRRGALFYRLKVRAADDPDAMTNPDTSPEATLANNVRWLVVNRKTHLSRILYVGGRPNWEHKFLNRALSSDPQLQLVSLIRIARKEAKFDFRGRAGESSNPLFRGFKPNADEETEDYSQPVLIRLKMRDANELRDGFPKEKGRLYEYDALILDDVEAAFFTHDQQVLLERFVAERGGGLLMLGGLDSFRNGKWERTPVADALPVYLNRSSDGPSGELAWQLTQEGWLEPWLRLHETEQAEQARFRNAPPLSIVNAISQIKPGARLLAEVVGAEGGANPAVVIQQYGQGRTGALLVGDLWKWSLQAEDASQDANGKTWRQMARWLVGDVPQRLEASVAQSEMNGSGATTIQVRLRNREFLPEEGKPVAIRIQQPDGTQVTLDAQPSLKEPGLTESQFVSRQTGAYVAEISVAGDESSPAQSTQIGWTSDPAADEFSIPTVNLALLQELAQRTGGDVISQNRLNKFIASFPERTLPVMETETIPLWHTSWILMTILALLAGEWGLRRWKGLA